LTRSKLANRPGVENRTSAHAPFDAAPEIGGRSLASRRFRAANTARDRCFDSTGTGRVAVVEVATSDPLVQNRFYVLFSIPGYRAASAIQMRAPAPR
jgi:hypothetical protein